MSHSLPTTDDSPLLRDDFSAFLTWRQGKLWESIRSVTGISTASDLENEGDD
jgi:hypothetical protein